MSKQNGWTVFVYNGDELKCSVSVGVSVIEILDFKFEGERKREKNENKMMNDEKVVEKQKRERKKTHWSDDALTSVWFHSTHSWDSNDWQRNLMVTVSIRTCFLPNITHRSHLSLAWLVENKFCAF